MCTILYLHITEIQGILFFITAAFFIGLANTFVHIIMYSYYGLAAIGPHMQKYLWWKRYLTSLQLVSVCASSILVERSSRVRNAALSSSHQVQFLLFLLHTGYNLFAECDFPDSMNTFVFGYCVTLIILFSNFYYQSYVSQKKLRKRK